MIVRSMYEAFYGLTAKPFDLGPDPRYLYRSESHASALELLRYAIERREGFVVITGEAGMGKTTLCHAVIGTAGRSTLTALVSGTSLSEEELLTVTLRELGIVSKPDLLAGERQPSRQELVNTLHDFLRSLEPLGARAVLIIDEAQNLSLPILEQVRILSNFETSRSKLLQIFLIGEPNLLSLLGSPELRQLDQRVSIRYQLKPLREEEIAGYVSHRLGVAKASGDVAFSPAAVRVLYEYTGGTPSLINVLCDRALLGGFQSRTTDIDEELVSAAAESLDLKPLVRSSRSILNRLLGRSRR